MIRLARLLLLVLAALSGLLQAAPSRDFLILVSVDGLRWDYPELHGAPTLQALARDGVRAERMLPSFPSITFPNHYSLVTGKYPAHHGIVANSFWDPCSCDHFTMARKEEHWWSLAEPIWITAERQGLRSACFFWPGSESEQKGLRPWRHVPYNKALSPEQRVDGLLAWLDLPEAERPRLITLYFDTVDTAGHRHGPRGAGTGEALQGVDSALARLLAGVEARGLGAHCNLVVVSDHGMSEVSKVLCIEDLVDTSLVSVDFAGTHVGLRPLDGGPEPRALVAQLRAKLGPGSGVQAYLKEEIPERFHYRDSERIPPVVLACDLHTIITNRDRLAEVGSEYRGSHGWDPQESDMGAYFVASGPAFRRGTRIPAFENVHLYNLLCRVLALQPAANDGDDRLAPLVLHGP